MALQARKQRHQSVDSDLNPASVVLAFSGLGFPFVCFVYFVVERNSSGLIQTSIQSDGFSLFDYQDNCFTAVTDGTGFAEV